MKPTLIVQEDWRKLHIHNRDYMVSSLGNVKRCAQTITRSDGKVLEYNERILVPSFGSNGRANVVINGKTVRVAHMIALAFIGERPDGYMVSHKNGDKTDDRADNLEYTTRSRNVLNIADGKRRDNTSGIRGITLDTHNNNPIWRGYINIDCHTYRYASCNKGKVIVWRKLMEHLYKADRRTA